MVLTYLKWHLGEMPLEILKGWRNIILFSLNYFSLPLLLKTLFSPWRRIQWKAQKGGFNPGLFFENLAGNLISRILGALIRLGIIAIGIIGLALVIILGATALTAWVLLPLLVAWSFFYGIQNL